MMTDNELKMMDALGQVIDYIGETSNQMEEDNSLLCKTCRRVGLRITLDNLQYPLLENAIDVFNDMHKQHGEEYDAYQQASGQQSDAISGRRKITAES